MTSTRENCLGTECPEFAGCHLFAARREAQAADIIIVNHHLLLADLALKESGFGDLLPGTEAVILDEAHQVPETAAQFFGASLSARPARYLGLADRGRIEPGAWADAVVLDAATLQVQQVIIEGDAI